MLQQTQGFYAQALTKVNFFNKREMAELPQLLMPNERVLAVISGFYTAGTAVLCVTSLRLLLVDRKFIRLSIEDVRFESIKEVNYSHQALMASLKFFYAGREMQFKSWHRTELRMLSQMVQEKMFEVREKLHRSSEEADSAEKLPSSDKLEPQFVTNTLYRQDPQVEQYLRERIARWRKASRFVDTLAVSSKAGRQILDFETDR